jgi:hypothetical protein
MSKIQAHLLQQFQQVQKEYFSKLFANFGVSQTSVLLGIATFLRESSLAATLWGWKAAKFPARLLWIQVSIKGKEINILLVGTQQKISDENQYRRTSGQQERNVVGTSSLPCHWWGCSGPYCRDLAFCSAKCLWHRFSILQNGMSINPGSTKSYCIG